jgi:hypothetical protein
VLALRDNPLTDRGSRPVLTALEAKGCTIFK